MKYVNLLRQRISLVAITLALACSAVVGISMWPVASKNEPKPGKYSEEDVKLTWTHGEETALTAMGTAGMTTRIVTRMTPLVRLVTTRVVVTINSMTRMKYNRCERHAMSTDI